VVSGGFLIVGGEEPSESGGVKSFERLSRALR
jgi:hypothetical protein